MKKLHLILLVLLGGVPVCAASLPEPLLRLYETVSRHGSTLQAAHRKELARSVEAPGPEYPSLEKAYTALREDDLDSAVEHFERAIELAPARADIRKDLAYTYLRTGENELARRQFAEVAQLSPSDHHAQLELAFLDYDTGETRLKAQARSIFARLAAEASGPERETARRSVEFIDAETDLLLQPFLHAVQLNPHDVTSHFRIAGFREERNEYEKAIEGYRHTLPGFARGQTGIARCLLALGRTAEAVEALKAALQLKDDLFSVEEARELLAQLGQTVEP